MKSRKKQFYYKAFLLLAFISVSAMTFILNIYQFLSPPTQRIEADILAVEGWVPTYILEAAAEEFKSGNYRLLLTSGQRDDDNPTNSIAEKSAAHLKSLGVDPSKIQACPSPSTNWNQTSTSARGVRERLLDYQLNPIGINLLTIDPHARQSWLAYRRIMNGITQVGIISVPSQTLDPATWWQSGYGWRVVLKLASGWLREAFFGLRS